MQLFIRSVKGLARGILLLGAIGTIGVLSAVPNFGSATSPMKMSVLAQGMMGGGMPDIAPKYSKEQIIPWEKPTGPVPSWLDGKEDANKSEEKIRATLNERVDLEFNAAALSTVMAFISAKMDIPIILDEMALEEESITPDEPITINRNGVKVRDAILQVLDPMQLTYKIDLEGVFITTRNARANKVRCYDLSHIFPDNGLIPELFSAMESMVTPDGWQQVGGNSSMTTVGSILLVNAPEETQLATERLLREISKQTPANMKPRAVPEKAVSKPNENGGVGIAQPPF